MIGGDVPRHQGCTARCLVAEPTEQADDGAALLARWCDAVPVCLYTSGPGVAGQPIVQEAVPVEDARGVTGGEVVAVEAGQYL